MPEKYYMYDRIKIMKPLSKLLIVLTSINTMIDMKNKTFCEFLCGRLKSIKIMTRVVEKALLFSFSAIL